MRERKDITGLWKNKNRGYGFTMNGKVRAALAEVPDGTRVLVFENQNKRTEKAPDMQMAWYFGDEEVLF